MNFVHRCLSVCQTNGSWSRAEAVPGPVVAGLVLPDPADPAPCPCPALNLTYNPNTEAGTTFHCTVGPDWSRLPARLPPTARCSLRCGGLAAAAVHCRAGVWDLVQFQCTVDAARAQPTFYGRNVSEVGSGLAVDGVEGRTRHDCDVISPSTNTHRSHISNRFMGLLANLLK